MDMDDSSVLQVFLRKVPLAWQVIYSIPKNTRECIEGAL